MGKLSIIATPIGNLKDITLRALEVLKEVDGIICEDSRRTSLLLQHYQIKKPLLILNDYNEVREIPKLLLQLQKNNLALVSDAGTPLISDTGYKLIRACIEQNIPVDSLPGPSSILPALTLSGLPPDKFFFLGYLPEKQGKRISFLKTLLPTTYITFVAPHKLIKTFQDLKEVFGNIEVVLAKELTKSHQSVKKQSVEKWLEEFKSKSPKGEFILLISPK